MQNNKKLILASILILVLLAPSCKKFDEVEENSSEIKKYESIKNETKEIKEKNNSTEKKESEASNKDKSKGKTQETNTIKLNTQEALKEYLVGSWTSDKETLSDYLLTESYINCNMTIDENLNINIDFYNRETNESKAKYEGTISFDRLDEDLNKEANIISIELTNTDYPGGDFLFKHRTIYDKKRVMSLFFAGNGNCIFDMLADTNNFEYAPEEIIFEKITGEKSFLEPNKNKKFYGVFWGLGEDEKSLWIDEVKWTPNDEYDPGAFYPPRMTLYENDLAESVLYDILPGKNEYIFTSAMYAGELYYVETDEDGYIIEFESAEYREYIDLIND